MTIKEREAKAISNRVKVLLKTNIWKDKIGKEYDITDNTDMDDKYFYNLLSFLVKHDAIDIPTLIKLYCVRFDTHIDSVVIEDNNPVSLFKVAFNVRCTR